MLRSNYRQAYILSRALSYVKIELCKQNSLHRWKTPAEIVHVSTSLVHRDMKFML